MSTTRIVGSHVDVEILVDGRPTPLYPHSDTHYVESVDGTRFEIRVTSRHVGGLLVLAAVDGRDAIDNQPADVNTSRGMILQPGGGYTFRGWRISDDETRQFLFTVVEHGVVAQVGGDLGQVGQIGIAVWTGRADEPVVSADTTGYGDGDGPSRGISPSLGSAPLPLALAAPGPVPPASHAVGIGAARHDPVRTAGFTRHRLVQVTSVFYRDAATLAAMGIVPVPEATTRAGYGLLLSPEDV